MFEDCTCTDMQQQLSSHQIKSSALHLITSIWYTTVIHSAVSTYLNQPYVTVHTIIKTYKCYLIQLRTHREQTRTTK